ncbi:unnamed protein product [Callosobruchus maculatus]|uniref:Uncharacterized protein n=1 Tax=Callosobruchus maculatus TaxID=64391 RepID=A0A653BID4_CALMS|nr:unnamed protein product [Callosobruchus maculatus]
MVSRPVMESVIWKQNIYMNSKQPLLSTMTKLFDEKLKEKHSHSTIASDDIPYVDESPEKLPASKKCPHSDKENIPELYRNPSLHKNQTKPPHRKEEKDSSEKEKVEDTMAAEDVPDNDRHITKLSVMGSNKMNSHSATGSKVRRSESLNKPERTSPMNGKLKRSESLNKSGEKLKRSDSLSKTEKTESNINKRRELAMSNKRFKDSTKNKRKNGMPDRSIKRRHTVGGTKDPDKVTWLMDNKNQEEATAESEKEKNLRTSSPDLSSTRRDRFLFEINLIGPENMVVALRQHLIGARPQSFPESTVFKVPLESHV